VQVQLFGQEQKFRQWRDGGAVTHDGKNGVELNLDIADMGDNKRLGVRFYESQSIAPANLKYYSNKWFL